MELCAVYFDLARGFLCLLDVFCEGLEVNYYMESQYVYARRNWYGRGIFVQYCRNVIPRFIPE